MHRTDGDVRDSWRWMMSYVRLLSSPWTEWDPQVLAGCRQYEVPWGHEEARGLLTCSAYIEGSSVTSLKLFCTFDSVYSVDSYNSFDNDDIVDNVDGTAENVILGRVAVRPGDDWASSQGAVRLRTGTIHQQTQVAVICYSGDCSIVQFSLQSTSHD